MDIADKAQEQIERAQAEAEARARRCLNTGDPVDECHACGEPLPQVRREMGAQYCVPCQSEFERIIQR